MGHKEKLAQHKSKDPSTISRRTLITKYGAYTAPTVVALLNPSEAYGHVDFSITYSTSLACAADTAGTGSMHLPGVGLMGHCMLNNSGGGSTHMVTNPTVP